jgi:cysteine desulfurase/selenocysteine lyase
MEENANIHRGVHYLSERATESYEDARCRRAALSQRRAQPRDHLRRAGTTEAINLVAQT